MSHLVRPKDALEPTKQDGVIYKIPCECGKVYIGETGRVMSFLATNDGKNLTTGFSDNNSKPLFNAGLLTAVLPWQW